jgi:hypothetical protein
MTEQMVPLGPWPKGVNNVDDLQSPVFQPSSKGPPPQLRAAENVDLDRHGLPRRRQGRTKRLSLADGRALASFGNWLLLVDGDTLFQVIPDTWTTRDLATGLPTDQPVMMAEHGGSVWWACGDARGSLRAGDPFYWGLPTPHIFSATPTAGGLPPGRYLVTATVERDGLESGAPQPILVDLPEGGGILVEHGIVDGDLQFYCSDPNGKLPYFAGTSSLIDSVLTTDPCEFIGCHPPPEGSILAGFGGRLLIANDNVLYWSLPGAYHHWRINLDLQLFPSRITMLAPHKNGFYVGTTNGVYWVQGDDPENWSPTLVDTHPALDGRSLELDGYKIPELQSNDVVRVWATTDGIAVGNSSGAVAHPTASYLAINPHTFSAITYREERGLRQILMGLRDQTATNAFAASDTASCRIVKAQSV